MIYGRFAICRLVFIAGFIAGSRVHSILYHFHGLRHRHRARFGRLRERVLKTALWEAKDEVLGVSSATRKLNSDPTPSGHVEVALTETDPPHIILTPTIPMVLYVCYMYIYMAFYFHSEPVF